MSSKSSGTSQPQTKAKEKYSDVNPRDILIFRHPFETNITKSELSDPNNIKNIIKKSCIDEKTFYSQCSGKKPKYTDYHITPIQRAMTYCMMYYGGSATSDQIVAFIRHFWQHLLQYNNSGQPGHAATKYSNPPDKRIIHMNFSLVRNNQPYFIPYEDNKWGPNTIDGVKFDGAFRRRWSNKEVLGSRKRSPSKSSSKQQSSKPPKTSKVDESKKSSEESKNEEDSNEQANEAIQFNEEDEDFEGNIFQEIVLDILKKKAMHKGLTTEYIISRCRKYKKMKGAYFELPLDQRVKAILQMKKHLNEVDYNENSKLWNFAELKSDEVKIHRPYIPDAISGVQMKDLTINDLWNILKDTKLL